MRKITVFVVLILMMIGCAPTPFATRVLEHRLSVFNGSGAPRSLNALVRAAADADAVFVGEIHDDSLTHVFEADLLRRLHRTRRRLAVSLEMFERDVQERLDDYLAGRIDEETFLASSRPWPNYQSDYRPLVEYARENGMPVLAMNVPRRYARRLAMMGDQALTALPDSERAWIAEELKALDDDYKTRFIDLMGENRPGPMASIDPENLYKAQCLKDDTMAESIHRFLDANPGFRIISYQGDFHSAFGLGIVKKLRLLDDAIETVVISVVPVDDVDISFEQHEGQGDFIVFVPGKK